MCADPGTLAGLSDASTLPATPTVERVLVSLDGAVFDTRDRSDAVGIAGRHGAADDAAPASHRRGDLRRRKTADGGRVMARRPGAGDAFAAGVLALGVAGAAGRGDQLGRTPFSIWRLVLSRARS